MPAVKRINGISADTYNRLLLDSGAVYLDYGLPSEKLIGATRGGNSVSIESENRDMTVDGVPGPVKGAVRRLRSSAKLTVNLVEITTDSILINLPGAVSSSNGTHDVISRALQIANGDYFSNVTLVLEKNGTDELFAFEIQNALALGNYDLGASEDDESVMAIEFTAHFDPTNLTTEPWRIYNPLEGEITYYTLTYTAGENGSIIGDGSQRIASGEDGEAVYASADTGFVFSEWSDASTDNPRQDIAVSDNVTVTAIFVSD
jgi:hypothetical protein